MQWWHETRFWIGSIAGFAAMFAISLWQLGWLPYLRYLSEWGHVAWLSLDVLLAIIVSLLVGWNVGAVVLLLPIRTRATGEGLLGAMGAGIGTFAFACVGCHAAVLSIFGIAVGVHLLEPWLPLLRIASLALLFLSAYLLTRKLRSPTCSR